MLKAIRDTFAITFYVCYLQCSAHNGIQNLNRFLRCYRKNPFLFIVFSLWYAQPRLCGDETEENRFHTVADNLSQRNRFHFCVS